MGSLFAYSLGISLPVIVMFAMYKWLLSRKTFHRFNRIVLLSIYLVAMAIIPLAQIVLSHDGTVAIEGGNVVTAFIEDAGAVETSDVSLLSILLDIYIAGVVLMIVKLTVALMRIMLLVKRSEKINDCNCSIVLHNHNGFVPFSWGRWIFMSHADYADCGRFVIAHERSHLAAGHWVDLLIAEAVIIINWFNPVVWLMRVELQDLHEYEADENVLNTNAVNNEEYQLFLIKKTVGARFAAIANSLNHSSLKKRITMMLSKKSSGKARMRAFALVPAAALALVFVNNQVVASTLSSVASTQAVVALPDKDSKKTPLKVSEKMPQFPDGDAALLRFIAENIKYPQSAKDKKVEGRVIVKFVVEATGKVSNPKVMRNIEESLDAEALRVISSLPDFIPGEMNGQPVAVEYILPVSFQLSQPDVPQGSTSDMN